MFEYEGELRAILCRNERGENYKEDAVDNEEGKITSIQLYKLIGGKWEASTKWSVDCWGITDFCCDSFGDLYVYYYDKIGNLGENGSKLLCSVRMEA